MRSYTDHSSWLRALAMGPDGCPGVELFAIPLALPPIVLFP